MIMSMVHRNLDPDSPKAFERATFAAIAAPALAAVGDLAQQALRFAWGISSAPEPAPRVIVE